MDLTQDVIYRNFVLNDSAIKANITTGGIGTGISGCVLDSVDVSDVDVVQFLEKRSLQDGMDAGDVFLGARRIRMTGTIYGITRANLYDRVRALRAALNPVLAQQDEPADKGFRPIYWSEPTNDIDLYPEGYITMKINAIPRAMQVLYQRDYLGGDDSDSFSVPWHATFIARDPRITGSSSQEYAIEGTGTVYAAVENRGDYPTPLNLLILVGPESGTIVLNAFGTINTITVPASTNNRIIRYKGADKLITVEENSVEAPALGWLSFATEATHPLIPHVIQPELPLTPVDNISITYTGVTAGTGSRAWFWEGYA